MRGLALLGVLIAVTAFAATRARDTNGQPPSLDTDGVLLDNAVGCRMSVRVDSGIPGQGTTGADGLAQTGLKLQPWYFDSKLGWVEGDSSLQCSVATRPDAGIIRAFVCPDLVPAARFGRIAVSKLGNPARIDAGTGADWVVDAGSGVPQPSGPLPFYRIECWGPNFVP